VRLELSPHAQRDLNKLKHNRKLAVRIAEALDYIAGNPHCGKELEGQFVGVFTHRVGDWRILYEVYKGQLRILVIRIAHRREVYR